MNRNLPQQSSLKKIGIVDDLLSYPCNMIIVHGITGGLKNFPMKFPVLHVALRSFLFYLRGTGCWWGFEPFVMKPECIIHHQHWWLRPVFNEIRWWNPARGHQFIHQFSAMLRPQLTSPPKSSVSFPKIPGNQKQAVSQQWVARGRSTPSMAQMRRSSSSSPRNDAGCDGGEVATIFLISNISK